MHTYNYHAHEEPLASGEGGGSGRRILFYVFRCYSSLILLRHAQLLSHSVAISVNECGEWPIHLFVCASEFIPLDLGLDLIDCGFLFDG